MCRYLRIVFECGHGHNTASIVPCSGPQNCFNPELFQSQLWKEGSKNPSRFPASSMTELAFRGVLCEACLRSAREDMRSMRKKIGFLEQRVEALRQAREAASAYGGGRWEPERSGIPEARVKAPQQPEHAHHHHSEDVEKTKNKLTQDQKVERMLTKAKEANERHARSAHRTLGTLTRTHTLCASGRCSNQAVVMNDGRKAYLLCEGLGLSRGCLSSRGWWFRGWPYTILSRSYVLCDWVSGEGARERGEVL
ncbi:hypothetical protein ACRE_026530 [Hapsidospora chrysogenum ATCC 11550]|uniref:Uncharacterized protein n=1 Tax=Hapsidospora chrysogenum (strain ATCC 11550 / CBS 779.69 / DSM 880 / IAM 14645 / JCM 23072 / IMI 49137) TaxID=857340 RepID=A0A086TAZ7_HAPC1|nr:hypothetical protein ACRE_026530 [Hapsidospora chrysogenum ATCC 11550]